MAYSQLHPLPDLRRLSLPGARQVRRRGDRRRPALERPTSRCCATRGAEAGDRTRPGRRSPTCIVEVNGARRALRGDIVVVSCGAANTAALLLRSANDKHPTGLANGSDQVGRNYMFHNSQAVAGALADAERHDVPEDALAERLLLRDGRL